MNPALEFRSVCRSFGDVAVLNDVSFTVQRGEFLAITGPSGSGKSTLLHLAALLDSPTGGRIFLEGEDITGAGASRQCELRKRRIGMIFQRAHLLSRRSALANVAFRFRYTDEPDARAAEASQHALDEVGLGEIAGRPARVLSGGEMQRVAIARAIALPPALLLADEPTGNLDRAAAKSVMDTLAKLNGEGITILLVTHNEELLPYCSRHLAFHDGVLHEAKR